MEVKKEIIDPPASCEIVSTRIVNAPVGTVFKAWSDPVHLKEWWGPNGFTNTFHEFELKPGGNWQFTMHGPDGTGYKNESVFVSIEAPKKLVWNHVSGPKFQAVANFAELSARKTKIIFRMIFRTAKECDAVKVFAVDANEQNFDKLENELKKMVR